MPLADTHERRWGGSIGGPLIGSKLFFYANYEGSNDKAIYGGGRAERPDGGDARRQLSAARRFIPRDPNTGAAVPGSDDPGRPHRSVGHRRS